VKIVLVGMRKSGKTQLCNRFQAIKFDKNYSPTPQIRFIKIPFNASSGDDPFAFAARVSVWDVVDEAIVGDDEFAATQGLGFQY
jgi:GTPase SAR1 family protein